MSIRPDTKNWTWVLERPCPDCGFDASNVSCHSVAASLRTSASQWRALLSNTQVASRPRPDVWSALEYGCHVRDVFRLFDRRLELMLTQDDPFFDDWDQDHTAVESRYGEQNPVEVATEIAAAVGVLAARFDGIAGDDWSRTGRRGDGAEFTIDSFSRYLLHDPTHHVWDVESGYATLSPEEVPA